MKAALLIGVIVLVLGVLSFVVPFPSYHHHGVKVGDSNIGVTTEHDQKLSPAIGVVLVVIGAGLIITGRRA
jgi:hypothetical protein